MMLTHKREDYCGHIRLKREFGKQPFVKRDVLRQENVQSDLDPSLL
jgi:hypothetical protein